jgi:hypothetical protein
VLFWIEWNRYFENQSRSCILSTNGLYSGSGLVLIISLACVRSTEHQPFCRLAEGKSVYYKFAYLKIARSLNWLTTKCSAGWTLLVMYFCNCWLQTYFYKNVNSLQLLLNHFTRLNKKKNIFIFWSWNLSMFILILPRYHMPVSWFYLFTK